MNSGTVTIGGDLTIKRLGLGTMRLTGPGMFGPPRDLDAARANLRTARDLGIDFIPTATVQNAYHVIERRSDPVIDYCEREGIVFIAYFPLATGAVAAADSILAPLAARLGITPAQAALAWLLQRSPALVAIPGTSRVDHLRENVAAADLRLSPDDLAAIEKVGRKAALLRAPKPQPT